MTGQNRTKASLARFLRWAAALGLLACTAHDLAGQVLVTGTVTDRSSVPVPEVRLVVESRDGTMARADATSGRDGAFRFRLDRPGRFFLSVDHPGFFSIEGKPIDLAAGANIVNVELIRSEDGGTAVEIRAREQLAAEEIAMSQALDEEEIDTVPMSRSTKQRIQGVAAILPGVLRHPYGELHFHGSPAQETNWVLDGFNVTDPATGRLEMALGAESVGSMDLLAGRYSAALGKGAGGAMVVRTRTGEDQFRQGFTNFVPGIDFEQGLRIRDWRPRYAVSGPIVENRLWFFNGTDLLYEENLVRELPAGRNRNSTWSANNSLRLHAKLTPRQTVSSGLVLDYLHAPNSGLSPLVPVESTFDRRGRRYFFNLADQIALSPGSVLDFGYAAYRATYWGVPHGQTPYRITAVGREGSYPFDALIASSRDEVRGNLFAPGEWLGQHQLRAGANLGASRYFQDIRRSPIQYFRFDGTQSSELSFAGSGEFAESNLEAGAYLQDRWAIRTRLVAELGLRWDYDRIVSGGIVTPRLSIAFMPPGLRGGRLAAGLGWIPASTYFRILTRHHDQISVFHRFAPDGATPLGPPDIRVFRLDRMSLAMPRTRNLSASWHQRLAQGTALQINYLRKRMHNGFAHGAGPAGATQGPGRTSAGRLIEFPLRNTKRDTYDSVEVSLAGPLPGERRWFASYTYSRAWSSAALDVDTGDPIRYSDTTGRLAWDIPHRLVSWASFPLGDRMSVALFAEWRDGFPFSVHDDNGEQVGQVNGWRLPRHASLNVHIERELSFLGHRWSLRPGVDNVTNRPNYRFANNNSASPEYLRFLGRSPIKLVVRVRWLGRAGK